MQINAEALLFVRPRLTEHHGLALTQESVDFAIPFLNEDIPLFVDPFLLWKSPSLQDQSLHLQITSAFNKLARDGAAGDREAKHVLLRMSECEEVGLGGSATRQGKRLGADAIESICSLFSGKGPFASKDLSHLEELQLFVEGISKDRVSDFACNLLKSFLIDFTIDQCRKVGIPLNGTFLAEQYDHRSRRLLKDNPHELPINPEHGTPILLVPKRWLRHSLWIDFDDYFSGYVPKDDRVNKVTWDRVALLHYNRDNYDIASEYVKSKELSFADCKNDPLFKQIPILSAKRKLSEIRSLPTGKGDGADLAYERAASALLASMFYPHLDFADAQVRVDGGSQIRDLIFYMSREADFLSDIYDEYGTRQLVVELKNVRAVEREHVNQLHRYLGGNEFGKFGVMLTRNRLPRSIRRNTVDLWSSKRFCLIPLTDEDLELMVGIFEDKRRPPIDVLKRSYVSFIRECPV